MMVLWHINAKHGLFVFDKLTIVINNKELKNSLSTFE